MTSPRSALVVEGGAMRGIFASGVLDTLMLAGYQDFDFAIGVSAGATNLAGYISQQPERSKRAILEYARQREFYSPVRFFRGGHLTDIHWLWNYANEQLPLASEQFNDAIPMYAAITHVETGSAHYMRVTAENVHDLMVATCAIPFAYRDQPLVNGEYYVDGGVADSIPVRQAYNMGARDITVVLSRQRGYRKKPASSQWMMERLIGHNSSNSQLLNAMLFRGDDYNASLDFIENPPDDCIVRVVAPPPEFNVSRLTMKLDRLTAGYEMGKNGGLNYLREVSQLNQVA
ncbi:MAG: patatin family protein [Thalassolituus sp.]|jgi:predicted patatin/cPLA2 family phospholipase|uniref:PNPLA domain-containing protein n=2 Tax=root TaxID=1 RepID=M5DVN7_9GAMM|nr:patatin family protein [Thalassolituus oleivorans]PHQ83832.1 MAG: patatin family protein [Thalassobium sp.]AHK16997.1 phospholipase [Thalassolituus oleivorans R6-15]APR68624.1 patatin family protein [Thalassolituus oleivorans]MBQ0728339.1 patatin family protein [Thalassolituus oleivorans]MBQ0782289.1 patatin family protein [Thalassolituus oleivorans]